MGLLFLCEVRGNFCVVGRVITGYRVEGSVRIRQPREANETSVAVERQTGCRVGSEPLFKNWDRVLKGFFDRNVGYDKTGYVSGIWNWFGRGNGCPSNVIARVSWKVYFKLSYQPGFMTICVHALNMVCKIHFRVTSGRATSIIYIALSHIKIEVAIDSDVE